MARGLAQWDAAVAKVEAGLASEIGGAPPPVAARMRATLGAVYLERGRLDAALEQFDAALRLDPQVGDVQQLPWTRVRAHEPASVRQWLLFALPRSRSPEVSQRPTCFCARHRPTRMPRRRLPSMRTLSEAVEAGTTASRPQFMVLDLIDDASVPAPVFVPAVYSDAAALLMQAKYDEAIALLRKDAAHTSLVAVRDERMRLASADARGASRGISLVRAPLWTMRHEPSPSRVCRTGSSDGCNSALGDEAGALRSFQTAAALPSLGGASHLYAAIGRIQHNQLDLDGAVSAYIAAGRADTQRCRCACRSG